jgi:hypothetical protein
MYLGVFHISRKLFPFLLVLGVLCALIFLPHTPAHATTGINQQINFQGRLLNTAGATVPDGYYNVQFKIYQDGDGLTAGDTTGSPAGSLKWTESYLNSASQGVTVINGFMSVQLGSVTPFGTNIDWNQSTIWLSINIGSTNTSCTLFTSCTPDGEMVPMKRMSASPYALNSGLLGGLSSAQFLQIAQGVQTDASVGINSIYLNKTSTGNFIDFQASAVDVFTITNSGDISLGANANHSLSVATAAAGISGKNLSFNAGNGGSGTGSTGGGLVLQGGSAGGTTGTGGAVTIDAGVGTGAGTAGAINIGSNAASTIQIGNNTVGTGVTQTINIGTNNAAGTANVTIGAGSGSTAGTTTIQSKGNTTFATNGTTRMALDTNSNLYLGDGTTSTSTGTFTLLGSTGAASNAGYSLSLQGGASGTGAVNGGDITVQGGNSGGSGVKGQVKLSTTGFITATIQNFPASASVTQANIDNNSSIEITSTGAGPWTATIPAPTTKNNGRLLYIQVSTITGATSISLAPSGGTSISMAPNSAVTLVWNTTANAWLNAGADSGSNSYIQNQTATTQTAAFKINGIGTAASFVGSSLDVASAGTLSLGTSVSTGVIIGHATTASTISIGGTGANTITIGNTQTSGSVAVGSGLTSGSVTIGGTAGGSSIVTIQGGTSATAVGVQSGVGGTIGIGTNNIANTIQIGSTTLSSSTQTIAIGNNNTAGGTTNVTIGSGTNATGGTTAIQSKANTTISTNGVTRATFDTSGNLYVGNGVSNVSPANFTIQGTASSTTAVTGGTVTVQGGSATTGTANGGNLVLAGGTAAGTGSNGLVILTTTSAQTVNDSNCYNVSASCTISLTSLNNNSAIIAGFPTTAGQSVTLPNPPNTTAGRQVYITASNGSQDFTLIANSGAGAGIEQDIAMRQNTSATMVWNGSNWTAAGASSSTTLQSAYNNTLQSAGGAELVVSKTSSTNGLTIRDSTTASVNGTLLQVQSKTAANLFSVSSNVSDYASDPGAELAGGTSTTFPASTWVATGGATVARNITTTNSTIATGQSSVQVATTTASNSGASDQIVDPTTGTAVALNANTQYNVSLTARLPSGAGIFNNLTILYQYDSTSTHTVTCTSGQSIAQTSWTKINCSFIAPSSGISTANIIRVEQASSGTARTFYVDNLSVTIAAGQNYATDGGVDSALGTNWVAIGGSATQSTTNGYDTSDSAQVTTTASSASGIKNILSANPIASNVSTNYLYRISVQVQTQTVALSNFTIQYSYNNSTLTNCADYNTQAVPISSTQWTQITCIVQTPTNSPTAPYIFFTQGDTTVRSGTLFVDSFSMTLANSTTPDVQIGSGTNGGPVTLFTLDSAASAPIAAYNASLYGSMYYDTTQGKIQCYQASGWGACGASPNSIVTISPEYTNAVMHGTGVGTMVSDFCSGAGGVNINDGTSGQPSICGSAETYNFYKWTSPQPTTQAYSIYVTYQLPGTFKQFSSGQTSLQARVDSTSNAFVKLQIYKNHSGLTTCGSNVTITTTASTWQYPAASGTADPSTCGFTGGDSIVFKITTSASSNTNAYVGNLNFTFSNS